jgi:hypothetical protein
VVVTEDNQRVDIVPPQDASIQILLVPLLPNYMNEVQTGLINSQQKWTFFKSLLDFRTLAG